MVWLKLAKDTTVLRGKFRNQDLLFTEIKQNLKSWKGYSLSPKVPQVVVQTKRKMQIEFNC